MVCELVTAGVEGGSWDRVSKWKMSRVRAMRSYWERNGPPMNVAVLVLGEALGIKWELDSSSASQSPTEVFSGPTIAELAAMTPPPI